MQRFITPYRDFLSLPDVKAMVLVGWIARLPSGMVGLSMLLFLRSALGSFALAGTAVGAYFLAMAITAPISGRIIDRHGPHRLLRVTGFSQPLMLLLLFAVVRSHAPHWAVVLASAAAGAFPAPISTLTRTVWRHRFADDKNRRMAFAVDAVTMELCFTVGPLIVAVLIALGGTTAAFLATTALMFIAFIVFLQSPTLRYWHQQTATERHLLGPLTDPQLLLLFFTTVGLTTAFGLLEVGYPALATAMAIPALAGVLLAINSVGSAIGGAVYGALHLKWSVERQFAVMLALMVAPLLLHYWISDLVLLGVVAFIAGATIAPSIAAQSFLVSRLAPAKYAAEAFTWSATFIVSGIGAGMALGGVLAEKFSAQTPFLAGAFITAAMALLALLLKRAA